ncbi:MAG: rhomboid family intramembrane serine protease [Polyangiaceae bacterium]
MRWVALFAFLSTFALFMPSARAGYSHYWIWRVQPDKAELTATLAELRSLAEGQKNLVRFRLEPGSIELNGLGDEAYEDFVFPGEVGQPGQAREGEEQLIGFNFCKTAGKPYDVVVVAALLIVRDHFPPEVLEILSDGGWPAWKEGAALYEAFTGRTAKPPFSAQPEMEEIEDDDTPVIGDARGRPRDFASQLEEEPAPAPALPMSLQKKRALLIAGAGLVAFIVLLLTKSREKAALGGRNCPYCNQYNANADTHCVSCQRWIPPGFVRVILREPLLTDLWATKLVAAICIAVFALQMAAAGIQSTGLLRGMPVSVLLRFGAVATGLEFREPWRFLSSCFVHMGILHIGMNLLALAELGRVVEPEIKGPRFLLAFVLTGVVGFLVTPLWFSTYISAGASGGVFGLDGVLIGLMFAKKDKRWQNALIRTVFHSFVWYFALRTNQAAHLGGLVVGLGLGVLYGRESRPWRIATAINVGAALSFVAIVVSLIVPQFSPLWRKQAAREERAALLRKNTGQERPRQPFGRSGF